MNTTSELEKAIAQFVDEKWELQRNIERISPCNLSLLKRGDPSQDKPEAILFKFIPSSAWKILVDAINRNISSGSTVSSQLKSRNRVATPPPNSRGWICFSYGTTFGIRVPFFRPFYDFPHFLVHFMIFPIF
jgi:hypothetical protein